MTLINRAAIYDVGDAGLLCHIPPWGPGGGPMRMVPRAIQVAEDVAIPWHAINEPGWKPRIDRCDGWEIEIAAMYQGTSAEDGLIFWQTLQDKLYDYTSRGEAREMEVAGWYDDESTVKRVWRKCLCRGFEATPHDKTWRNVDLRLVLRSQVAQRYAAFTAGGPAAGPYENYLYSTGEVGSVVPPSGTVEQTVVAPLYVAGGTLWGTVAETVAANEGTMQWRIRVGAAGTVRRLTVTQARWGTGSGATTLECSDTDWQSAGNAINGAVAAGEHHGAPGSGSFTVSADDYIYVYVPSGGAGAHGDVSFAVEVALDEAE